MLVEPGNHDFQTQYQTWEQAVDVHTDCFIQRPYSTVHQRWMPWLLAALPEQWCRPVFHWIIKRLQPRSKLCKTHYYLGYTPSIALYDQVMLENTSKNIAQHIAWRILNDISDEDLAWVRLAPINSRLAEERMAALERRIHLREIGWSFTFPERQVKLAFPADMIFQQDPIALKAIRDMCEEKLGPGKVLVG
ncbi:MAG: hypothetical protein U1B30_15695 [Pseudomonadota bacterium]|nr:hypothetical protein [Pseudomonadota bacterium]